jgi:hypothetical protein
MRLKNVFRLFRIWSLELVWDLGLEIWELRNDLEKVISH